MVCRWWKLLYGVVYSIAEALTSSKTKVQNTKLHINIDRNIYTVHYYCIKHILCMVFGLIYNLEFISIGAYKPQIFKVHRHTTEHFGSQ